MTYLLQHSQEFLTTKLSGFEGKLKQAEQVLNISIVQGLVVQTNDIVS